jgi:hypothetical protein
MEQFDPWRRDYKTSESISRYVLFSTKIRIKFQSWWVAAVI